jgi:O-antigen ligase
LCTALICALFWLDRDDSIHTSKALWIPTFWLFIGASRNVSEWMYYSGGGDTNSDYLGGSPIDRAVLTSVLALGVIVLIGRGKQVMTYLRNSLPILLYFAYCAISISWSDYPDVAFKRWFRALGDVVMVLIVLTDPDWLVAIRRLFSRIGFILLPLSVLFIRYFPDLGRGYSRGGSPTWTGVATDKNALGMLALLFGLAYVYRFLQLRKERREDETRSKGPIYAHAVLGVFAVYLLYESHSATAFACFFLALGPMLLTYYFPWARKPIIVNAMVFGGLGLAVSALFLGMGSGMVEDLGRNSTLTGRTEIWQNVLPMAVNPLAGAGFESFWLGSRLTKVEIAIDQTLNQAHNGYIEIYLNLGWIGLAFLAGILASAYMRILGSLRAMSPLASLRLAFFIVAAAYNFTEAGFKMMHPVWICFLLAAMILPEKKPEEEFHPFVAERLEKIRMPARQPVKTEVPVGVKLRNSRPAPVRSRS